jgi:hypothetical protein
MQTKVSTISALLLKLRKTNDKNNIYRETMEIFHDANFVKNMDTKILDSGFIIPQTLHQQCIVIFKLRG